MNAEVEGRAEKSTQRRHFPLKELSLSMDPDLIGGNSCILLQLLDENPRVNDLRARHSKAMVKKIENWNISKATTEIGFCNLWEKNLEIEVLKEAQALAPQSTENLEAGIVQRKSEGDKWKIALLKGIVFKKIKEIEGLEQEARELRHEVGQESMEMEATRKKAAADIELLKHEVGEKNMEIEATRKRAAADIELLKHEVGEKNMEIEATRKKAAADIESKVASSMESMTKKRLVDELRIELLREQLAKESKATKVLEKRMNALLEEKKTDMECELVKKHFLTRDLENFPATKRIKLKGGAEDRRQPGDEEASKQQSQNDNNSVTQEVGLGSDADFNGSGGDAAKRTGEEQGGAAKKNSHSSKVMETPKGSDDLFPRKSDLRDNSSVTRKANLGGSLQKAISPSTVKKIHHKKDKFSKSKDYKDNNSATESQKVLRLRSQSPKVPVCLQSAHNEDDKMPQQRVASPTQSAEAIPSSEPDSDEEGRAVVVPDPEFHDFDRYRTEKNILPGQVWAIYDDQDGMPRFYGHVSSVATKPFRAHINWLEPSALSDKGSQCAESTGLSTACGKFKMGKSEVIDNVNCFSHLLRDKSGKGMFKIYPKKGQVWAIHRDPEQTLGLSGVARSNAGSEFNYDMVEILSQFSQEKGLKAALLLKVIGSTAVFCRQDSMEAMRYFKPTELVKFSHYVLNERISDQQANEFGIPRGSLELDPAAVQ